MKKCYLLFIACSFLLSNAFSQSLDDKRNEYEVEKIKIEELEKKAQYSGDDDIVRKNNNLPPKLQPFEEWLKTSGGVNKNLEPSPTVSMPKTVESYEVVGQNKANKNDAISNDSSAGEIGFFAKLKNTYDVIYGYMEIVLIVALLFFPICILILFEIINPTNNNFKKVREFPVNGTCLYLFGVVCLFFSPQLGVLIVVYASGLFVNDGLGCFVDFAKGKLTLPAYCKERESFLSYLNPLILLSPFYRVSLKLSDITSASLWSETSIQEDNNGKINTKIVNKVQIATIHGSFVVAYRSSAKCERLISLLKNRD